uniref:Uncharacterized protein n=1 Tax=Vibrio vulnificus TaxID=672 RepID=A0A1W6ARF6_VIBVL|nr:hypothetical protein [Vibrio vulnificus]ARJ33728.1 hypothetical protein [Vibrio vulnificus]
MKNLIKNSKRALLGAAAAMSLVLAPGLAQAEKATGPVEGLWKYTGLTSSSGVDMPLTGIFLLADGYFLQQAVFNGEPVSMQQAMAHSGTYSTTPKGINLEADQTLGFAPKQQPALSDAGATQHELSVTREGDSMQLVFGSGTVQGLAKLGDANDAEVFRLENGMLAFADGYFVLVDGGAEAAVTGYGQYSKDGDMYRLDIIRWSEGTATVSQNLGELAVLARFDGKVLELADGRRLTVAR